MAYKCQFDKRYCLLGDLYIATSEGCQLYSWVAFFLMICTCGLHYTTAQLLPQGTGAGAEGISVKGR